MTLDALDWSIIALYLVGTLGVGVLFAGKAGGGMADFFLAGRKLPWWLAGTSIVATTFAADTPLMVSGFVRSGGIWQNWFWWSAAMSGIVSVVIYARLWRRSGVLTDLEFIELRYHGKAAATLRVFLAGYAGIITNCLTMGVVLLAMAKIGNAAFGFPDAVTFLGVSLPGDWFLLTILVAVVLVYTVTAGMWGVVMTDALEFGIAMFGAIVLMVICYVKLGGPTEMVARVTASPGVTPAVFAFVPDLQNAGGMVVFTFAVYISVQWWASTSGTSTQTQRMLSCRDERQSTYGALWGSFAHYVIRPWPWIIVGVASLAFFPLTPGEDPEAAYPRMMMELLPTGLRGLMVVAFLAAFMSTMDTKLNWGASYVINDLYARVVRPGASDRHYVWASRVATVVILVLGVICASMMDSIIGAWMYLVKLGAGTGLVVLLRWFWWRINAWSEITALVSSFVLANALLLAPLPEESFAIELCIVVAGSTLAWVTVTLLTRPTDDATLDRFYRQVRPGGWWGPVAARHPDVRPDRVSRAWPAFLSGVTLIYAGLFGLGYIALGGYATGGLLLAIAAVSAWFLLRSLELILSGSEEAEATTGVEVESVPAVKTAGTESGGAAV